MVKTGKFVESGDTYTLSPNRREDFRPWRNGLREIAIGLSGLACLGGYFWIDKPVTVILWVVLFFNMGLLAVGTVVGGWKLIKWKGYPYHRCTYNLTADRITISDGERFTLNLSRSDLVDIDIGGKWLMFENVSIPLDGILMQPRSPLDEAVYQWLMRFPKGVKLMDIIERDTLSDEAKE